MDAVPEDLLRQRDFLRRLARSLTNDAAAAEDIAQEAELRALKRAPAEGALGAWLTTVTRRLAANVRRARARREEHERGAARAERVEGPLETLAGLELQARVLAAVRALEEPYRTTLWLRFYEDLPPSAIAGRMEAPLATVKTRLARGLAQLRLRLDTEHGGRREAWALALLPLSPHSTPLVGPLVLGGFLTMKQLAAFTLLLVLAVAGWRATRLEHLGQPLEPSQGSVQAGSPSVSELEVAEVTRATREDVEPPPPPTPIALSQAGLAITARWPEGTAATDLGLVLVPAGRASADLDALEARTDTDGRAEFVQIEPGGWTLYDEGGGRRELVLTAGSTERVELVLAGGLEVEGRVVDPDGNGIGGAEIWVERHGDSHTGSLRVDGRVVTRARADGTFRLRGLEPSYALGAFARGYAPGELERLEGRVPREGEPALDVEIVLRGGAHRLLGRVLDARGECLAGALVALGVRGNVVRGEQWQPRARLLVSDAEGRFEAEWIANDVTPTSSELSMHVLGRRHALQAIPPEEVYAALGRELVVHLVEGAVIGGTVRTPEGAPCSSARVEARCLDGAQHGGDSPFAIPVAVSDGEGRYELAHVAPGAVELVARSADEAQRGTQAGVLLDGMRYEFDFVLGQPGAIVGRVVDEQGTGLAERTVIVHCGQAMWNLESGGDGHFRFVPKDPEQECTLYLLGTSGQEDVRLGVRAGDEVTLVSHPATGVVLGTFIDTAGRAVEGRSVRASLQTVGLVFEAELGAQRELRFESVAAGTYRVAITCGDDELARSAEFTLFEGEVLDLGVLESR